eukprot:15151691-Alexandrium_andersonii.AAC.1
MGRWRRGAGAARSGRSLCRPEQGVRTPPAPLVARGDGAPQRPGWLGLGHHGLRRAQGRGLLPS